MLKAEIDGVEREFELIKSYGIKKNHYVREVKFDNKHFIIFRKAGKSGWKSGKIVKRF